MILITTIRQILQGTAWSNLFDECGYSVDSSSVCQSIRQMLKRGGCTSFETSTTQPSLDQLRNVLPRKKTYRFDHLFWITNDGESVHPPDAKQPETASCTRPKELRRLPRSSQVGFLARTSQAGSNEEIDGPIALRTRSHSRILADSPLPSLPSGSQPPAASESCPFSMSSGAVTTPTTSARRRRRAAAIPRPTKPQSF